MRSTETLPLDPTPETASSCSERRLAAHRAHAQLSTGPTSEAGQAISSLNAVKTGLTGQAILFSDAEEARQYQAHLRRVFAWWEPAGDREHTLVQSLADTQGRLNSIPGLESALRALAQARGTHVFSHPDPTIQRLLLQAQAEIAEAKAIKNLRLQESRLLRRYERDEAELKTLRSKRFAVEAAQARAEREQQFREAEAQRRRERAQKRAARQEARAAADTTAQPVLLDTHGFEFSTSEITWEAAAELCSHRP